MFQAGRRKRVTIKDVAQTAGVSTQTVSRVVNKFSGVSRETLRRSIRIPDQLAVVGFDNIPESAYFYPALTTIYQDLQLLGEQAVQSIVEMIQTRQENHAVIAQSRFIQPTLVVRESSKCAR